MMNPVQSTRSAYIKLSLFVFLFTFTWAASFGLYAIWLGIKPGWMAWKSARCLPLTAFLR